MFKREDRYIVFKKSDLTLEQLRVLGNWQITVNGQRFAACKMPLSCVVVESDWPEFEMVWDAIQMRIERPIGERTPEQALDLLSEEEIRRTAKQYYRMVHSMERQLSLPRTYEQGAEALRCAERAMLNCKLAIVALNKRSQSDPVHVVAAIACDLEGVLELLRALPTTPKEDKGR